MAGISGFSRAVLYSILIAGLTATLLIQITDAHAQGAVLEEVIVTAQRREQSLQDVPISIGVYTGEEIDRQGYRNLNDLGRFSASVQVQDGTSGQNTTIRGFGTAGSSLTLMSATPLFVDGVHFGSLSMVKNAFMDTERVEVLKGPQPLHFGMNATAGAFNIISKRPTAEWEGDVAVEFGNDGRNEVTVGTGGPLTESLGIRVAGIYEQSDGPLKNRIDGDKFPRFDNLGGRVILQWEPSSHFTALGKFEINRLRNGGEIGSGCLTEGRAAGFPGGTPIDGGVVDGADAGNSLSVFAPAPKGLTNGHLVADQLVQMSGLPTGQDCFDSEYGLSRNGPFAKPVITNVTEESADTPFDGFIDVARVVDIYQSQANLPNGPGPDGIDGTGTDGSDNVDAYNALLDMTYTLNNGITVNSQTGYVRFYRNANSDSRDSPFYDSFQNRQIDMYEYSQQLRVQSRSEGYDLAGGMVNMEFLFGGFWQAHNKDVISNTLRSNFRRGQRFNKVWEDARWFSGFWGLSFNFLDDQLALEVGGRYTDVHKEVFIRGFGAAFVYDERPCDSEGTDFDPVTCTTDPDFKRVYADLTEFTHIDPFTGNGTVGDDPDGVNRIDNPRILLPNADLDNLWTHNEWRDFTPAPLNYRGSRTQAVGLTAPVFSNRNGPFGPCAQCLEDVIQDADHYDSQVVLRYTPDALDGNHTIYGKYAEAFKGPVTDTGTSTIPDNLSAIQFNPEYSTSWEIGVKGTLFDGRARYAVTGFMNDFKDLQTDAAAPLFNPNEFVEQQGFSLNAGKQTVDGIEFNLDAAVTENFTVNFAGAIMDAKFKDFDGGGCIEDELIAAAIDATTSTSAGGSFENRSADELDLAEEILSTLGPTRRANLPSRRDVPGSFYLNGGCRLEDTPEFAAGESSVGEAETIDRSGQQPAFAPDWKFVLGLNYTRPVFDDFEIMFNTKGYIEAEKTVYASEFDRARMYNDGHWDINISGGIGTRDGTWRVIGWARNLMGDKISYNPEYELERKGVITSGDRAINDNNFRSYGVRFEYSYR